MTERSEAEPTYTQFQQAKIDSIASKLSFLIGNVATTRNSDIAEGLAELFRNAAKEVESRAEFGFYADADEQFWSNL